MHCNRPPGAELHARFGLTAVETEDLDATGVGSTQVEGALDESGLACAIGADQSHRGAGGNLHADAVEGPASAEALDESLGAKGGGGHGG